MRVLNRPGNFSRLHLSGKKRREANFLLDKMGLNKPANKAGFTCG
jgi:hypothetical protein